MSPATSGPASTVGGRSGATVTDAVSLTGSFNPSSPVRVAVNVPGVAHVIVVEATAGFANEQPDPSTAQVMAGV